jgi:hypothetical protein
MIGDFKTGNRVASPPESVEEGDRSISIIREGGMVAAGLA